MTIKTQAYLQGYLHAKTAAVGLDPNKPIPPNIQQHLSPWTGKETATDTSAEDWRHVRRADAIAAGNQWPTLPGESIPPGRRPDGSLNWPWAKQWLNPMPLLKGIRDTAKGVAGDAARAVVSPKATTMYNKLWPLDSSPIPSVVRDTKDMAKHIRKDPVYNTKQLLKDMVYGPGGAGNIATAAVPAAGASRITKSIRRGDNRNPPKVIADEMTPGQSAVESILYPQGKPLASNKGIVQGTWPGTKPFGHPDWLKEDTGPRMGGDRPEDLAREKKTMDLLKRLLEDPDQELTGRPGTTLKDKLWSGVTDGDRRAAKNKGPREDAPPGSPIGPQSRDVIPEDVYENPYTVPTSWYTPRKTTPGKRKVVHDLPGRYGRGADIRSPEWETPGEGTPLSMYEPPDRNPTQTDIDMAYGRLIDRKVDPYAYEPPADASALKEWRANGYLIERKRFLDDFVEKPLHDMTAQLLDADVNLLWGNYYGPGPKGMYYVDAKGGRRFRRHPDDTTTGPETSLISYSDDFGGNPDDLLKSIIDRAMDKDDYRLKFGERPANTPTKNSYTIDNPLTGWN